MSAKCWWVYMIQTQSGKLYTGISTDVERRYQEHCGELGAGKGAKFFRTDKPRRLVYRESLENRSLASKREYQIKQLTRAEKLKLFCGCPTASH